MEGSSILGVFIKKEKEKEGKKGFRAADDLYVST